MGIRTTTTDCDWWGATMSSSSAFELIKMSISKLTVADWETIEGRFIEVAHVQWLSSHSFKFQWDFLSVWNASEWRWWKKKTSNKTHSHRCEQNKMKEKIYLLKKISCTYIFKQNGRKCGVHAEGGIRLTQLFGPIWLTEVRQFNFMITLFNVQSLRSRAGNRFVEFDFYSFLSDCFGLK